MKSSISCGWLGASLVRRFTCGALRLWGLGQLEVFE
jgi:hypothetical protein